MRLSLMQSIDYWAGIPLCFLCSCVEKVRSAIVPPKAGPPKNALLIELSEMGSTMLAYPALKKLRDKLGEGNVFFMIFERNREGIDLLRVIPPGQVITIDDTSLPRFFLSTLKALWRCRQLDIDAVIDFEIFSRCTALLSWLSGARIRSGLSTFKNEGSYRGALFTHPLLYSPHHHMSATYFAMVEAAFESGKETPLLKRSVESEVGGLPVFQPSESARAKAQALFPDVSRKIVVLNPDPGLLPLRGWPISSFRELAEQIVQNHPEALVVVVGVKRSHELAKQILQGLPERSVLDLTGRTANLEELLAILERSDVLVTIDAGPAHFSGMVDVHRIVLFGPETPALYRPIGERQTVLYSNLSCSPCFSAVNHRTSVCRDNRCLKEIPAAAVLREVEKHL